MEGLPDDYDVLECLPHDDDDNVLEGLPRPRCEAWLCRSQDGGQPEDGCGKPIIIIIIIIIPSFIILNPPIKMHFHDHLVHHDHDLVLLGQDSHLPCLPH